MKDDITVFAPQDVWDKDFIAYKNKYKSLVSYDDAISKLIYEKVQPVLNNEKKDFFEIGCYLARYMYHFGKLGYTLNGIDQTPEMGDEFKNYLINENFNVGNIELANVFELNTSKKYDFVASFGFIEHFSNFLDLIDLHFELAKKDGFIMITIPNLRGRLQYLIHWLIDKEHLDIHNMKALNPLAWQEHLKKHDYDIVFDDYVGGFSIWVGNQKRNIFQKILLKLLFYPPFIKILRGIKKSNRIYSPYYCLIAKKK